MANPESPEPPLEFREIPVARPSIRQMDVDADRVDEAARGGWYRGI